MAMPLLARCIEILDIHGEMSPNSYTVFWLNNKEYTAYSLEEKLWKPT